MAFGPTICFDKMKYSLTYLDNSTIIVFESALVILPEDLSKWTALHRRTQWLVFKLDRQELWVHKDGVRLQAIKDGNFHRDKGPAMIYSDGSEEWLSQGKLHRDGGPAVIWANQSEEWWQEGNRHRDDGPAVIYADGSKEWWQHDFRNK